MASSSSGPPDGKPTNLYEGQPTQRTVPEWVDPISGQLEILLLRATSGNTLPSNPFTISKTILPLIGSFQNAKSQRDENNKLQYVLKIRNQQCIAKLLEVKRLVDGSPVEIIYHPTLNQRKCVVSCREVIEMTETELTNELSDQRVTGVRRIMRRNPDTKELSPTATLVLTIQGTVIPDAIYFGFIRIPTRAYYPNPMQCYDCFQFGHTSKNCKQQHQLCRNCGQAHHDKNDAVRTCEAEAHCVNCSGQHQSTSRQCPVWLKENNISKIRTNQGISFKEARAAYETQNNGSTYASIVQQRINNIQNTGCNRCKCNCSATKEESSESSTDSSTDTETSSESEESDAAMESIEMIKNIKRKLAMKDTTSDEQRTSEEERRTGTKKKIPRNENMKNNQTSGPSKTPTSKSQQPTSTKNNTIPKKKNNIQ